MEFSNILYDNFMSDRSDVDRQQTNGSFSSILPPQPIPQQQMQQSVQQQQQQQLQQPVSQQQVRQQHVLQNAQQLQYHVQQPISQQQQQQQQAAAVQGPPQIIFIQSPKMTRSFEKYPARMVTPLSWIQIFTGIMSIILGIANPLTCGLYGMVGIGVWGGVLYLIAGVFGLLSARRKTSQTIVTHMVLSIIGCICASVQLALNVTAAYYDDLIYGCWYYRVINERSIDYRGTVVVDALLAVFGVLQGIVAIIASVCSCKVVCCSSAFVPATGPYASPQNGFGGVMNGGAMVYYNTSPTGDMSASGLDLAQSYGPLFTMQNGKRNGYSQSPVNSAPPYSSSPPTYTPSPHY